MFSTPMVGLHSPVCAPRLVCRCRWAPSTVSVQARPSHYLSPPVVNALFERPGLVNLGALVLHFRMHLHDSRPLL